ncbi:MAG: iron-containing redox enzyme family protein [Pseudomonas profundi]|uniref:iron-containing redox enzyme family protein n=1 Tax=Pseudomonas profundi TaxID=1981513 RepID=UPI0030036B05
MLTPDTLQRITPSSRTETVGSGRARLVYQALLDEPLSADSLSVSRQYLEDQLQKAARLPCELPSQPEAMVEWMEQQVLTTGDRYAAYLESRKAGQPRRYFSCKSHALAFLQGVAPTKLVDGAWLYGVLDKWNDNRFYGLIRTYLEELGDGVPAQNHVVLYQRLLAEQGCETLPEFSDDHYLQGALQLALGYHADAFLPELIGYNLGYEQLPLHLLISAFELNELDIDPYYFTLHVTIDNAATGHARKAVQAVLDTMPAVGDRQAFLKRVADGYRLNDLGLGTVDVIEAFDLESELIDMFERKRAFGQQMHSDFCRIGGRTVNEWLSRPGEIPGFLAALEERGWIKRHEDPAHSRFWQLVDGPDAQMFGVFSCFEKQLLRDWIAGDWFGDAGSSAAAGGRNKAFRPRARRRAVSDEQPSVQVHKDGDVDQELVGLQRSLRDLPTEARMRRLIELMAPASHHTAAGLLATRLFTVALG